MGVHDSDQDEVEEEPLHPAFAPGELLVAEVCGGDRHVVSPVPRPAAWRPDEVESRHHARGARLTGMSEGDCGCFAGVSEQ